jgi:nitrite reductase/ring-hydroxylating ferredoxin subunit
MEQKKSPPSVHNTWVFIGWNDKIKPNEVKSITALGRDLVLWRTKSGKLNLNSGYCTHLGAHLGKAEVSGEVLKCNFHKFCYKSDGTSLSTKKNLKNYTLNEQNGMVFAWIGDSLEPNWPMPNLLQGFPGESVTSSWKVHRKLKFNMNCHVQDLFDNTVDPLHFKTFHNQCISYEPAKILEVSESRFLSSVTFSGHPKLAKFNIPYKLDLVTDTIGACALVVNSKVNIFKKIIPFKYIFLTNPKNGINTDFTVLVATKENNGKSTVLDKILYKFLANYGFAIQSYEFYIEAKKFFEPKTYLEEPDFRANEQALKEYHLWYEKFYALS